MLKRKRVSISFIVDDIYLFQGCCSANVSIDSHAEILDDTVCYDIEDLEDVEFMVVIVDKYDSGDILNELDITDCDIQEVRRVFHIVN